MNVVGCDETSVRCEVRSFLCENFLFGDDGAQLGDHDSLIDRHVLDSTGFLELIAFLESRFGVRIEDLEMLPENLDSIASVTRLMVRKLTRADSPRL